jgi:hypothetical protein
MIFFQAGDTILKKINSIPKAAKLLKGESVLHYGNTGNHHSLKGSFKIYKHGDNKYVDINRKTDYIHEEHKTISLPKGKYVLTFVQEYDHFLDLKRPVID